MLSNQAQFSLNNQINNQINNQFRPEEESRRNQPKESAEISAVLQDIKENHLPITQDQVNADHQEAQSEEELLQGLILQECYEGDLQEYSADQIKGSNHKRAQANRSSRSRCL